MTTIRHATTPLLALLLSLVTGAAAQEARSAPGPTYGAGPLKALLLGRDYRDLWLTPMQVSLLDLRTFAGGLTPTRRGGGRQTRSLRLVGADGREYSFRSVDKAPDLAQHPDLHGALLGRVIQDQVSSIVPAAALVATPLTIAVGVPTTEARLFVMPDDPMLGEFRAEFAGMLGTIEERADEGAQGSPGFGGLRRIVSTETMLDRLEEDPAQTVDEVAYLTARLTDLVLGDWDRHADQWRWGWAESPGGGAWIPIARDRDYAFSNYDGLLLVLARRAVPNAVRFGPEIEGVEGLVLNAFPLDRQLLAWTDRAVWDAVARDVQARLTDEAIEAAIGRMPPEHHALRGAELVAMLKGRRGSLPAAAAEFYRRLTRVVEIRTSDDPERAEIERRPDGSVEVRVEADPDGGGAAVPVRRRVFHPDETREIRILLRGGDDVAVVQGRAARGIRVRVIGGGGDDGLSDESAVVERGVWTLLYDDGPRDRLRGGRRTRIDRAPYTAPDPALPGLIRIPPQDAGDLTLFRPVVGYSTTNGPVLGAGVTHTTYGFRRQPHASRLTAELRYSPRWSAFGFRGAADFRSRDPALARTVHLSVSQIDAVRFYGFGNEVDAPGPASQYRVRRDLVTAEGAVRYRLAPGFVVSGGPVLSLSRPEATPGTRLERVRPLGWDRWASAGAAGAVELRRTVAGAGDLRVATAAGFSAHLPLRGGRDPYGDLQLSGGAELPFGSAWMGAHGGWRAAWGAYPFHEAAFLGGGKTLRGLPEWRFAGDAVIHGTLEAGVATGRLPLVFHWRTAIFGFVDVGRVFLDGESSRTWHSAPGIGVRLSALEYTVRISYAHAPSRRLYLGTGSPLP